MGVNPLVTVITVCYNEGASIKKVIDSVLSQTYTDFEYIIKDGGSTDETLAVAEAYRDRFRSRGIDFVILTGKDKGLYDAMNAAALKSRGMWINYMNADDRFFDGKVLERIFGGSDHRDAALLYGDALECEFGEYYYYRKCPELIEQRMPFNHQTVFARRDVMLAHPFDLKYRIGADYNFLLTVYREGLPMKDSGTLVSVIAKDGVSTVRLKDTFLESIEIRKSHGIPQMSEEEIRKALRFVNVKQFGMDHFPSWLKYVIRRVQRIVRHQNERVDIHTLEL